MTISSNVKERVFCVNKESFCNFTSFLFSDETSRDDLSIFELEMPFTPQHTILHGWEDLIHPKESLSQELLDICRLLIGWTSVHILWQPISELFGLQKLTRLLWQAFLVWNVKIWSAYEKTIRASRRYSIHRMPMSRLFWHMGIPCKEDSQPCQYKRRDHCPGIKSLIIEMKQRIPSSLTRSPTCKEDMLQRNSTHYMGS